MNLAIVSQFLCEIEFFNFPININKIQRRCLPAYHTNHQYLFYGEPIIKLETACLNATI